MLEGFLFYCLACFFWFYLLNNSDILAPVRHWLYPKVFSNISYALQCIFCSTFWATLVLVYFDYVPLIWVPTAPVFTLFLLKIFNSLNKENNIP